MSKRILALLLCAVMLVSCFSGCAKKDEDDLGAYVTMYLSDDVYDFDPANAYYNTDATNIVGLMFDTLFKLDENGKVKKSLVDKYEFKQDKRTGEHFLELTLKEAYWSNGTQLSAADVFYAWKRLLDNTSNYAAASLLYDIKNARAVKEGNLTYDYIGIEAVSIKMLKVTFEGAVDEEQFLLNLTSLATAPLLENCVSKNADWAKKPSTMVTSGAYKFGKVFYKPYTDENGSEVNIVDNYAMNKDGVYRVEIANTIKEINYFYLERNKYYYRDVERDSIDKSVTSYRILVDCSKTDEEILQDYKDGKIFYIGSIPLSLRGDALVQAEAKLSKTLSTFVCFLNQYAVIDDGASGTTLFANAKVREALSLVIDRTAIANEVVYASAATGLVAPGVFDGIKKTKKDFRDNGTVSLATTPNKDAALTLLNEAGITDLAKYSFTIRVSANDDVNVAIANKIKEAWVDLGFTGVTVEEMVAIQNNDTHKELVGTRQDKPTDICDDTFIEALQRGEYEVAAFDYTAYSADAYSVLSNFASAFSGMSVNIQNTIDGSNRSIIQSNFNTTGYFSIEYNNLMEAIYYIPYFASLDNTVESSYLHEINVKKPYVDAVNTLIQNSEYSIQQSIDTISTLNSTQLAWTNREKLVKMNVAVQDMQNTKLNLLRAYEIAGQTFAKAEELDTLIAEAKTLTQTFESNKNASNAQAQTIINALLPLLNTVKDILDEASTVSAQVADTRTLYQIVEQIYADNGITPSKKSSDWATQKNTLLHKAEELLMKDMPVIPVIFTQNAIIVSDDLSKVDATYYIPAYFRKTKLKNYNDYTYTLIKKNATTGKEISSEICSIFDEFPVAKWDQMGQVITEEINLD